MSNRPVRLKYLKPKMKIILCIFLLYITAVSVFGQSVELNGTLGKSIEFPAAVKKGGSLMYGTLTIGEVASSSFRTSRNGRFNGRLDWNSSTGFFSLSGLKMEDIGEYKVQNTDQNIITVFQLNVYTVSVFGQSVELNGILGESVKFPAAVKKGGYLMYRGVSIGDSSLGKPGIDNYRGRLDWDSCTGLFSLSGLKMEDIGEYKVHNTDQNITVFQLNVYKDNVNVSKPHVSITQNEYPCTIECTAERGTEATLSWYREGQTKPYSRSSVRSAPHLDLPQTVERSGTYTCEAKNSVSNEKASITVGDHCTAPAGSSTKIIVAIIIAAVVVVVLIAVFFALQYYRVTREIRGFKRRPEDITRELRANRSKHSTKDGKTSLVLSPDAVSTLIHVTKLLNDLVLHASGKTSLVLSPDGKTSLVLSPDAVSTLIHVTKLFHDFVRHTDVKKLFHDFDRHTDGKTSLVLSPDGKTSLVLSPDD